MTGTLFLQPYMKNICIYILQKFEFLSLTDISLVLHYLKQHFSIAHEYQSIDIIYITLSIAFPFLLSTKIKNSIRNKYFIYSFNNQIYNLYLLSFIYNFIYISYNNIIKYKHNISFEEYSLKNAIAFIHISIRLLPESSFLLT